jgi:hypothetical protein
MIIGREKEQETLRRLYTSKRSEFLALYGRRRIGKTFLITEYFKNKGIFFEVTGLPEATPEEDLVNFHREFCALFKKENTEVPPADWSEAFYRLQNMLETFPKSSKIVIFFDEMPWLANKRSNFLSALDYFWNRHASRMNNILLIVCGSAASWMIHNVINNKGGLHGRLSAQIRLLPFKLSELEEFLKHERIELTRKQICELYMVTGGVPKYLSHLPRGNSAAQLIHHICFTPQAPLLTEFHKLYHSLFRKPEGHIAVIKALAKRRQRLARKDLNQLMNGDTSRATTKILDELEESGFITRLPEMGKKVKDSLFMLNDEYSIFYLNWIDDEKHLILQNEDPNYWSKKQTTSGWLAWAGYAFESMCLKHIANIKTALKIGGVITQETHWQSRPQSSEEIGVQIDLVIDRADQCINICEIKFCNKPFLITKKYAEELARKKRMFKEKTDTRKTVFLTIITPYGAVQNDYYVDLVDNQLNIDDLFKS